MKFICLLLILVSCRNVNIPMSLGVKGNVQSLGGAPIINTEGYICVDFTVSVEGKYRVEKSCAAKGYTSKEGTLYADFYPEIREHLWLWQKRDSLKLIDYQVYLRSEGKVIRGEFPNGKPVLGEIKGEVPVVFVVDQMIHSSRNFYDVKYVSNYDGDTIKLNIPNVHPLLGEEISIRVRGIQTPEIKSSNECEKQHAYYARDQIQRLFENGKRIDLYQSERGKYFRIVADILLYFDDGNTLDLRSFVLNNRLGVAYEGDTKPDVDWCEFSQQ